MEQIKDLWKQVFGEEEFWDAFFRVAFQPDHCLTLEETGRVQAALYWFDCSCGGPWAYIFAVATHPDFRGQGLCRRLMEKAHSCLAALGYDGALLVPAEPGLRSMYQKMGYREATTIGQFPVCAAEEALPLRPLQAAEYAAARRMRLPEVGVIQEGCALALLEETGSRFFAGDGCLLAANGPYIQEFLGNRSHAPGALAALGHQEGFFRCPGRETPFAMAIPFREGVLLPQYFAFAFD